MEGVGMHAWLMGERGAWRRPKEGGNTKDTTSNS